MEGIDWDEIYEKYEIPPNLRQHMKWVAQLGRKVAECLKEKGYDVDADLVERVCFLHDMGNIIKFNLDSEISRKYGLNTDYWKSVKEKFIRKYGNDEFMATVKIARELGFEREADLMEKAYSMSVEQIAKSGDWNIIAFEYADLRVAPYGITSLEERLKDFARRYGIAEENLESWRKLGRVVEEICGEIWP